MVDRADLQQAERLDSESRSIDEALHILDNGGTINGMLIGDDTAAAPDVPPRPIMGNVMIRTAGWDYPLQMVEAIRDKLRARKTAIDQELADLGVTGSQP